MRGSRTTSPATKPASWLAGGKTVKVDRVDWIAMPDQQTAVERDLRGRDRHYEQPPVDLLPLLQGQPESVTVGASQTRSATRPWAG